MKCSREAVLLGEIYAQCGADLSVEKKVNVGPAVPVFLTLQRDGHVRTADLIWRPKGNYEPRRALSAELPGSNSAS